MKVMKGIAVALTAAILASGGGVATSLATAQPAQAASTQSEIDVAIAQILNETNAERANAGLAPLRLNASINVVAQKWTESMATQKSMYHNPSYQFQMPQPWMRVGENVGQGYTKDTIVAAWMASPGHKANILGDFTHIGLGYWIDETGRGWFTQNFGKYDVPTLTAINEPVTTAGKFDITATWDRKWEENVQDYKAELYSPEGTLIQTKIVPVSNATVTFNGLADSTSYSVKIVSQSTNAVGEKFVSPVKTNIVTTLEDVPTVTAPTDLALVPGEDRMTASWTAPTELNGTLQPYKVELLKAGTVVTSVQTDDPRYTFTNLNSNTNYTVKITATTAVRTKTATASTMLASTTLLSSVANVSEPTNVATVSENFSSVKATWGVPTSKTGANLKYIVTLSSAGKADVIVETTSPSYTFTGLKQTTDYAVKVQASITAENGVNNKTTTGVTSNVRTLADYNAVQVTAPTLLPVDVKPTYASLNWNAPATVVGNLTNYTVTVKQAGKADRVFTTTNKFFVVTDLLENSTYSFEVKANAASLNGANTATAVSATITGTTPYAPDTVMVSPPTSVALTMPNPSEVSVSWKSPTGTVGTLTGYKVTLKSGTTTVKTVVVTGLGANFSGLASDTNYTVEVVALATSPDETSNAASSAVNLQFSTVAVQVNAPTGLLLSDVSYNSLKASWTAPSSVVGKITKYSVIVKQGDTVKNTYYTTENSYLIPGLSSNSAYTVEVRAYAVSNDGQEQKISPVVETSVTTLKSPVVSVTAPVATLSGVGADRLTVAWTKPAITGTLTGYKVVVKQGTTTVKTVPVSMLTTSTIVTGLNERTAYTVTVEATALAENNTNSATGVSLAKGATTTLSAASTVSVGTPVFSTATSTPSSLNVAWNRPAITGILTSYTVTLKQGTTTLKTLYTTNPYQSFTGLKERTGYTVYVKANVKSSNSKYTASSATVSKTVSTTLSAASTVRVGAPASLYLSPGYTNVIAYWKRPAVTGILTSYTVTIKQGTRIIKTVSTSNTYQNLTGLTERTGYTVEVKANAKSSNGKYTTSATVSKAVTTATTAASTVKVGTPTSLYLSPGYTNVIAYWKRPAVTGILTSYTVTIKQGSTHIKTYTTTATKMNFSGLKRGTTYTVYVKANAKSSNGKYTASSGTVVGSVKTR